MNTENFFWEKVDKRDLWEGITQEYLRKLGEQERRKWKKEESELAGFFMEIGNKREIGKRGREGMTFFFLVFSVLFIVSEPI